MTISPKEAVRYGWETYKKRPWFFSGVFFLLFLLSIRFGYQANVSSADPGEVLVVLLFGLLLTAIQILARMGKTNLVLRAHENVEKLSIRDIWKPHPFWRFVGGTILQGLITLGPAALIGLIWMVMILSSASVGTPVSILGLLFIAGIIWAIIAGIRLMFVNYLIIDKGLGPIEALRESVHITQGHMFDLFVFCVALFGINLLAVLPFFLFISMINIFAVLFLVLLLVSVPVSLFAVVYVYRQFEHKRRTHTSA